MHLAFPECNTREDLAAALRGSDDRWSVLVAERTNALFSLHTSGTNATVDQFVPEATERTGSIIMALISDLKRMKVETITIAVPEELVRQLLKIGFARQDTIVRLSGPVVETNLMPILPLSNASERDIPGLARLMHESYVKEKKTAIQSATVAEKTLRGITVGQYGRFMSDCSFLSGTVGNPVSACFITCESPHSASVIQLFTHPLYRARGLATSEITNGMNRLLKLGFLTLSVWLPQDSEVAKRLFTKLGFGEDGKLIQMSTAAK
jgi:hypothetical protein